ncbi:MAG: gliding motility-associated lipoprotein GldK, partial [Bacteroidales bacterium]|nr:gliding motility-associated lipoprotein GldK [Bacteroidales bacterium]
MKRLFLYTLVVLFMASCSNSGNGELVGTRGKSKPFYQPDPYGMVFIPMGSYTMGAGDEDLTNSHMIQPKTISV